MKILTQLTKIKELPTLPEVMFKVQKLTNSNKSDANMLSKIIKQDPALSSTILKTANSVFYNVANKRLSSVKDAITRIGFDEVLRITMGMSVIEQFNNTKSIIGYKSFWCHSLTAANMTSIITEYTKEFDCKEEQQNLFLAGLLHDVGILIYDQFFHDEFEKIINYALEEEKTYIASEEFISPKETHAFIGGALLEIWKLALPVIAAVRYHHTPFKAPEKFKKVVYLTHLIEYILCNCYIGSFEGQFNNLDSKVLNITGLSLDNMSELYMKAKEEAEKNNMLLSMSHNLKLFKEDGEKENKEQFLLRNI